MAGSKHWNTLDVVRDTIFQVQESQTLVQGLLDHNQLGTAPVIIIIIVFLGWTYYLTQILSSLNLSVSASKFYTSAMFAFDLHIILYTKFSGLFMIYLHTEFHMSIVITIQPRATRRFYAAAMLLFYILQNGYITKYIYLLC